LLFDDADVMFVCVCSSCSRNLSARRSAFDAR
jgi:hypothetical protein